MVGLKLLNLTHTQTCSWTKFGSFTCEITLFFLKFTNKIHQSNKSKRWLTLGNKRHQNPSTTFQLVAGENDTRVLRERSTTQPNTNRTRVTLTSHLNHRHSILRHVKYRIISFLFKKLQGQDLAIWNLESTCSIRHGLYWWEVVPQFFHNRAVVGKRKVCAPFFL